MLALLKCKQITKTRFSSSFKVLVLFKTTQSDVQCTNRYSHSKKTHLLETYSTKKHFFSSNHK